MPKGAGGLAALIGLALMFTRLWPGVEDNLAHAHHVIGSLVLTVVSIAAAEVARPARWLNVLLGAPLISSPFVFPGNPSALACSVADGAVDPPRASARALRILGSGYYLNKVGGDLK